eukprot:TRINITY_DN4498_c0_g1_i3.p1 TRINITY_DN4498_c0_g1~~TRINITY_DN4498_c0_g1_i3.p1  ORF type:complete len:558 (-),score=214.68 TRINITY_DN4498_c0_g1_i3:149-1822(-)
MADFSRIIETELRGEHVLHDPILNKGTAFTNEERECLKIKALLPPHINTLEHQAKTILRTLESKASAMEKYIYLTSLYDRNTTLFYKVVIENIAITMPILYTPVVGEACIKYGEIFRRPRGLYITKYDAGKVAERIAQYTGPEIEAVVMTDGERILGLGDLGLHGMPIPIGKLILYTACGGVNPQNTLPITIDVGTNNEEFLKDPDYLGIRERRLRGQKFDELIEEINAALTARWPGILIQFEDFGNLNAFRLLKDHRNRYTTFNDDIQGTASVCLGGVFGSCKLLNKKFSDNKFLFLGAGEAGTGIADLIVSALIKEGMSEEDAIARCWFVDSRGLVVDSRRESLAEHKLRYAHKAEHTTSLLEAVKTIKPTALIGVSGQARAFTEDVVKAMCEINERPMVFALSNPTSKAECTAEQAYTWSNGKAVFCSGSPFAPVTLENGQNFVPGQGNNAYIFPGVGLGVIACKATSVTDDMFYIAAQALCDEVRPENLALGCVYPSLDRIREVSVKIAAAVVREAYREGLQGAGAPATIPDDLEAFVKKIVYNPIYPTLLAV